MTVTREPREPLRHSNGAARRVEGASLGRGRGTRRWRDAIGEPSIDDIQRLNRQVERSGDNTGILLEIRVYAGQDPARNESESFEGFS